MTVFCALILLAFIVKVLGDEAATSNKAYEDTDGYTLLELSSIFRLVDTTLPILTADTYRCITATTTEKNDTTHEVTETVEYYRISSDKWESFSQIFLFTGGQDGYNTMNSDEHHAIIRGPPSGNYDFLLRKPDCTILRANSFQRYDTDTAVPEERDEDGKNTEILMGNCMLWAKHDLPDKPDNDCETQFVNLCGSTARHHFSTAGCQKASTESRP
uniref:Putative lipocalin-6 1 n=1 Tax=Amblyomma americanum TaxID=6943 RepID=A0A0C9RY12_AMBAM